MSYVAELGAFVDEKSNIRIGRYTAQHRFYSKARMWLRQP